MPAENSLRESARLLADEFRLGVVRGGPFHHPVQVRADAGAAVVLRATSKNSEPEKRGGRG